MTIRVVNGAGPTNDKLAVQTASGCATFDFGSLDLGSSAYVGSNVDFVGNGSNARASRGIRAPATLRLTLGSGGPVNSWRPAATPTYTISAATDPAGNADQQLALHRLSRALLERGPLSTPSRWKTPDPLRGPRIECGFRSPSAR